MKNIKSILLFLLVLFLFLPILQENFKIFEVAPLNGATINASDTTFNWRGWFEGSYQHEKEKYINENFGLRNWLIRINNQIAFSCFKKVNARDVIVGKENYLYEKNYISAYNGEDFIGEDSIQHISLQLRSIQDNLKKRNIDFIVILAPGKASFFPEFIPDHLSKKGAMTNYLAYAKKLKELGVNLLDFNDWFLEMKSKSNYPLYPKCGIHWSNYSIALVTDSIVRYIESKRKIDLPEIKIKSIELSKTCQAPDNDVEQGLNLCFNITGFEMAYPNFEFIEDGKVKPRVLTIADSYYWSIFGPGIAGRVFEKPHFWYYYKQFYAAGVPNFLENRQINFEDEINQQQIIILMSTEATLSTLGWGFIEDAYRYLNKGNNSEAMNKKN